MSSWELKKLSEVADIIGGATPKSDVDEYFNGDIPWITPKDLSGYKNRYISKGERNITKLGLENSSAKLLPKGAVLFTSRAPIGYVAIADNEVSTNQGFKSLVLKDGNIPEFFYYLLKHNIPLFEARATGSTFKEVSGQVVKNTELLIPSIDIQKKIVDLVSPLDEKIELNTQINQTLEQIAQTIFKSWFIDFDPVHAKANALASGQTAEQATQAAMAVISGKNTQELHRLQTANPEQYQQLWEIAEAFPSGFSGYKNLGEIPIGWNVLTFKDFISESKEKIGSLEDVPEYSVGNEGIYPRSEKYNKSLSKTPEKNKVVRIGDLVFGMGSKTLNWGIMNDEIGSVSPAYFVYRIFTNINYIYLNKYIKAKEYDFQNLIKPTSRQGQSVDKEMFLKKEIYVPNEYLLNIYLNKLKEIDSLVYSYTTEVLILEQIRDELLPKLLSGEKKICL